MGNLINLYSTTPVSEQDAQKVATYNAALQIIDDALSGKLDISTTGGTTTLTGTPAAPQAQHIFLNVSGTLASNGTIEIPVAAGTGRNRIYVVKNGTTGAFTLTVKKVGGTGVTVTQGKLALLLYDGSDIVQIPNDLGSIGAAWASYTPTWTNLSLGNGTVVAKFTQTGKTVFCRISIVFGSTTSISGDVSVSLPVTSVTYAGTANQTHLGAGNVFDATGIDYPAYVSWSSTTLAKIRVFNAAGTNLANAVLSSTVPFTWAVSDEIDIQFTYEAA